MPINLTDYRHVASQRGWGAGWPSCAGANGTLAIVTADRSGTRVSVHKRIARLIDLLIDETERRGYLLKSEQTGGFNCRAIAGTRTPSNHSWGLALDINWQDNPFTKNRAANHIPGWMPPLWNRYGFAWGGNYIGKHDFMHFEFMGGPDDADAMTALSLHELTEGGGPMAPVLQEGDGVAGTGDRGRMHWYVLSAQALCNVRGLSQQLELDGMFGPSTRAMVRELQTRSGLPVNGVVDAATWSWLLGNDAPDFA